MKVENNYIFDNDNVYLEVITSKGFRVYFMIDIDDLEFAKSKTWYAMYCPKRKTHYLESKDKIKFHRYVTNCPNHMVVDHVDRDTYDNRKSNLRICTVMENNNNRYYPSKQRKPKPTNTGIQYISYMTNGLGNYYYSVSYNKIRKRFKTKEEAIMFLNQLKERVEV